MDGQLCSDSTESLKTIRVAEAVAWAFDEGNGRDSRSLPANTSNKVAGHRQSSLSVHSLGCDGAVSVGFTFMLYVSGVEME